MRVPVAIVGIGCRFPGGISDPESFWRVIASGTDAITEIPREREGLVEWYDPRPTTKGRMASKWGGFLDRIEEFDAGFFGISPREAERIDPQQRLLLETSWEALEDAGVDVNALDAARTGVYVGQWASDFESKIFADTENLDLLGTSGSGRYAASGRISYALGLRGPSLTIDTACSSSLAAIHVACGALATGECTVALAGGVNVILEPHITIAYSQSRMMAPDGRCKFGDASGDGYVRSEGAGMLVLKTLDRAVADGDHIYAVVRGSAVNNDGRSSGVMGRPSQVGHEEMLRTAYESAGVAPSSVGYVEAHGTGTRAGDPVEIAALGAVLGPGRASADTCLIGSVKTNFGHTEGAAGVAGVIKAALAIERHEVPPSLHFRDPNPAVPWKDVPFVIPRELTAWNDGDTRVAGVNSFGIAGTNAHVVLGNAPDSSDAPTPATKRSVELLPISARSDDALRALAARYADLLDNNAIALRDVCWSAATRRTALSSRAATVAGTRAEMQRALRQLASGNPATAQGVAFERPKVAFVFPGQGAQWLGMGRELLANEPVFRAALERCDAAMRGNADWSIVAQLGYEENDAQYRLNRIDVIQPVLVALGIAYAELWRSFGVEPDGVVGHSMGEIGAAYLAGVLRLEDAMRIVFLRSALMHRVSGQGAMALVELPGAEIETRLRGRADVSLAVSNSPRSSVISGTPEAVRALVADFEKENVFARLVKVDVASHSPQMDALSVELRSTLAEMTAAVDTRPIYSTVRAARAQGSAFDAAYWAQNLRQPVRFGETIGAMVDDGFTVFIEMGPHPILTPSIEQSASAKSVPARAIASGRRDEPEVAAVFAGIAEAYCAGCAIAWDRVMPEKGRAISLPLYPWQRERHWFRANARGPSAAARAEAVDERMQTWLHTLRWEPIAPVASGAVQGNWVVVADDTTRANVVTLALRDARVVSFADAADAVANGPAGVVVVIPDTDDAGYVALPVVRALVKSGKSGGKLWIVTNGAQYVDGHAARVAVNQASAWGSARVIAEEHPELWGGAVDLDPKADAAMNAAMLALEIGRTDGEDQVAFRGGKRFGLRLMPTLAAVEIRSTPWRADAAYLVTGGLGAVGLRVAAAMVAAGVRRLVLLGRTPLPPRAEWPHITGDGAIARRVAGVRALERAGAAVHVINADVADYAAMERALRVYADEAWPPIHGVVHAAGTTENRLIADTDRAIFDRAVLPKLAGARNLDRLFPDAEVFVLFSSISAWMGPPGMANYSAANAGVDALAQDRRARGANAISIQWGVWESTGLHEGEVGEKNLDELRRQGIHGFAASDGASAFGWLIARPEASVSFVPIDWRKFAAEHKGREKTLVRGRMDTDRKAPDSGTSIVSRVAAASPVERRALIEGVVRDAVGRVLRIEPQRIDRRRPFGAMGLSSLMALELRNRLETALERPLSATLAWNYPTTDALVAYLADATPQRAPVSDASTVSNAPVADVSDLSDDDAARALRGGR